jgi:GNAT superfamily N-acetyltransferase
MSDTTPEGRRMVAPLVRRPATIALPVRTPTATDLPLLAESIFDAYLDSADATDEATLADAVAEVQSYLDGASGEPLLDCSFVALDEDFPVSASLISLYQDIPLLAYTFTTSDWKGKGLSTALTQLSINALAARGYDQLTTFIADGDSDRELFYESVGFRDE